MSDSTTRRLSLIERVVGWLRDGYPEGIPEQDYIALFGILQRALTPVELDRLVDQLAEEADGGRTLMTRLLVEDRIEDVVKGQAAPEDVQRVSARLAAAGWPLGAPGDPGGTDEP